MEESSRTVPVKHKVFIIFGFGTLSIEMTVARTYIPGTAWTTLKT